MLLTAVALLSCMAAAPSLPFVAPGIQLGAVDFLAKPLSPLKLQNIWQHTVRKMMGNMNINCSADASQASAPAAPAATAAARKELDEMEVILEEQEQQAATGDAAAAVAPAAAATNSNSTAPAAAAAGKEVVNTIANVALATASSLYEPTKCLSRSASSAATETSFALVRPGSPTKGAAGCANKLHKSRHAPVHSCPSTRSLSSLNSMSSCYSNVQLGVPPTPSSPSYSEAAAAATTEQTETDNAAPSPSPAPVLQQQRCIKKAVRHGTPAPPASNSKPPLASTKPQAAMAGQPTGTSVQQQAPSVAPMGPGCGATAAGPLPMGGGLTSVPLPTGLGQLPQGMVWGMPMCPLARAPGIVPPASGTSSTGSQAAVAAAAGNGMIMPPMPAWGGMCGMPMGIPMGMPPAPFMAGMPGFVMPPMPMAMPFSPFAMTGMMTSFGMGGSSTAYDASAQQQQGAAPGMPVQDAAAAAAAPVSSLPVLPQMQQQSGAAATGAAMAAALNATLDGLGTAPEAGTAAMDLGDAFDFMLGDITAEDDLDVGMSGLLDGELTALEKEGLKLPADLQELQALEAQQGQQQQYQQQRASLECSNRISFDCHGRQRVSLDCSTASTTTGARVSFECAAASRGGLSSQRVSFEVSCNSAARAAAQHASMAAPAAPGAAAGFEQQQGQKPAAASAACNSGGALLGSMSDLFAACSGDSCSEGSGGMTHVDSCGMLADLQSLFASDGCAGVRDDGCSGAAAPGGGIFDDVMDDLPLELAMKKSSSLAELLRMAPMQV